MDASIQWWHSVKVLVRGYYVVGKKEDAIDLKMLLVVQDAWKFRNLSNRSSDYQERRPPESLRTLLRSGARGGRGRGRKGEGGDMSS